MKKPAKKKAVTKLCIDPIKPPDNMSALSQDTAQTPRVNVEYLQERAYRRGLMTALECIIRELR